MNPRKSPPPGDATEEVSALVEVLRETEQRLEELTAGEVDAVVDRDGRTLLLRRAQDQLRYREAATQRAIFNALPAHIALLDTRGVIISVNETWRRFDCGNAIHGPGSVIGVNYLEICDSAPADDPSEAHQVAEGIRSVLGGGVKSFSLEFPCHSPMEQRWFLMTVTPVGDDRPNGAVVMHLSTTERRRTQVALAQSEAGLQRAEVMAKLAHVITGPGGSFERWSDTLPQLIGVEPAQLPRTTRSWLDILHPDDRPLFRDKAFEASVTQLRMGLEYRLRRADGEWIHVRQTMEPLEDEGDASVGSRWFNTLQDVTVERRTEESLYDSELRFRQMAENIRDVFFLQNLDSSQMYYVSPAYEQIWGRTCESLYANPASWADSIHPDDLAHVFTKFNEGRNTGSDYEFRIVRPDGEMRWIHTRAFPILDDAGIPYRTAGVCSDITQRKQAAEELRRSESLKGAILESSLDCLITIDHDGKIVEFNPAAEATFGFTREQALGQAMVDLIVPPPLRDAHRRGFAHYLATGKGPILGKRLELEAIRADGTEFPIELAIAVLPGTSTPMFTSFIRDITARKEADEKIRRLNRVYAVLSGINTLIVRVRDRGELFKQACRIAVESGQFPLAWVAVADPHDQLVKAVAWAGDEGGFLQLTRPTVGAKGQGKGGLSAQAIETRIPAVCNDIEADGSAMRYAKEALERGYRSAAALPLVVDGTAIGALVLYAAEAGFFDDEERSLLVELAGDISFALEHIEKEEKVRRLTRVHAVLSGINAAIVRIRDREELFREACRIAVQSGQFLLALVAVADPRDQLVKAVAWAGDERGFVQLTRPTVGAQGQGKGGLSAQAIEQRIPAVCDDIDADGSAMRYAKEALERGYRSAAALPLMVDGTAIGALVLYAAEAGFFDDEETRLLLELAGNISFALDHIAKEEKLDYLAYYDALTGLANRSLFLERLAQYMRSAASGRHKLALYLLDLERFKNINDSLGQPAGDALLRQVAVWLTHNVGDANLLARVGADHFAVVLPEIEHEEDVARLLEKTMEGFLEHPFHLNDAVFRIAAKVGVAVFPEDGADADNLYKHAEVALKKAKASGDRYLFFTQKMSEAVAGKLTLENQLRQALDKEEFVLHYQPKVNLQSGKLTGAEALIRWNDPHTGLVPPGRFIPILEETGLIHEVGRWALRKAIEDYLRWRAAGLPAVRIAVNVSPLQLRNRGFIAEIEQVIGINAHAAAGLELEVTESLIMEDVKHNIASLQAIRALGITIAIDDFGTGFSSLSYLSKLPVDTLKIDRSFVNDMTVAPQGLALVSTIITLAHSLKLNVVAEGVETEEQSRLLRSLNCDEMQGFLFSKPVPGEIFETRFLTPPPASDES